jgi:hypothetical protein
VAAEIIDEDEIVLAREPLADLLRCDQEVDGARRRTWRMRLDRVLW